MQQPRWNRQRIISLILRHWQPDHLKLDTLISASDNGRKFRSFPST
jgi:hypothetical protein